MSPVCLHRPSPSDPRTPQALDVFADEISPRRRHATDGLTARPVVRKLFLTRSVPVSFTLYHIVPGNSVRKFRFVATHCGLMSSGAHVLCKDSHQFTARWSVVCEWIVLRPDDRAWISAICRLAVIPGPVLIFIAATSCLRVQNPSHVLSTVSRIAHSGARAVTQVSHPASTSAPCFRSECTTSSSASNIAAHQAAARAPQGR